MKQVHPSYESSNANSSCSIGFFTQVPRCSFLKASKRILLFSWKSKDTKKFKNEAIPDCKKTPAPFKKIEKIKGYLKFCCMLFCGTILIQPWTELFPLFNFVFCCNWNGILFWWEGVSCIYINIFSQWNVGVFYDFNKTTKKGCFRESRRYSSFLKLLRKFFPFYGCYGIYVYLYYT